MKFFDNYKIMKKDALMCLRIYSGYEAFSKGLSVYLLIIQNIIMTINTLNLDRFGVN